MNKIFALLMMGILLISSAAVAEDGPKTIQSMTDLGDILTDWYPQIVFYLTDGTCGGARFEARWLSIGGMENYEINNAEDFWNLTATLVEKHAAMSEGSVPAGWNQVRK